jgi:N-acetylmuramoyl-L-alanine amidase
MEKNVIMRYTVRKKIVLMVLAAVMLFTSLAPCDTVNAATLKNTVVVVLDPGHGGDQDGATRTWDGVEYVEKDLNLAIALACKAKLEQYEGVKVYITRSTDKTVGLEARVNYAKKKNADLFVSIHNNYKSSTETDKTNGVRVYYPNKYYKRSIWKAGKKAAQSIQDSLVELGLKDRGIKARTSTSGLYSDGSPRDYYSVIRNSKLAGFPGLIVEHAFVSNKNDCQTYLGSEEMLTQLGEADAVGIAEYFSLNEKTDSSL